MCSSLSPRETPRLSSYQIEVTGGPPVSNIYGFGTGGNYGALLPGQNTIMVVATDIYGNTGQDAVTVTYEPSAAASAAGAGPLSHCHRSDPGHPGSGGTAVEPACRRAAWLQRRCALGGRQGNGRPTLRPCGKRRGPGRGCAGLNCGATAPTTAPSYPVHPCSRSTAPSPSTPVKASMHNAPASMAPGSLRCRPPGLKLGQFACRPW